jgi:transcriptional regulator with XRE-family HTH domain
MEHEKGDKTLRAARRNLPGRMATLRGHRTQRGWGRELGVFQQNLNRYESGTAPNADFLITVALKEGVRIDWLLLGRGPMLAHGREHKGANKS